MCMSEFIGVSDYMNMDKTKIRLPDMQYKMD
jgi:hypothetical protein